jgi:predicted esterase
MRRNALLVPALGLALALGSASTARAQDAALLRAIADDYAQDGDLDKALAALKEKNATPAGLLAALRAPRFPEKSADPGELRLKLEDDHGKKTDFLVVTPSAAEIAAHAPKGLGLVVLLHGLGGNNSHARNMAEKLAALGDVIAVAPTAQVVPAGEGTEDDGIPSFAKMRHWWAYDSQHGYALEAIRKARSLFPIDPDRVCLSGMSMGGYGTWNIGLRHPDCFAGLAPLAGGISRFSVTTGKDEVSRLLLENGRLTPFLSVHGNSDSIVPYNPDKEACDVLKGLGGKVELVTLPGVDHDLQGVHQGSGEVGEKLVHFLGSQHRDPSPASVTYVSLSEKLDGAYWLRIAARAQGAKSVKVEGTIDRAKNSIGVSFEGAQRVRVYLDDRVLDLSKPVAIDVSGKPRVSRIVEPSFRAMLESWRSRHDEKLVYPAFVDLEGGSTARVYR